MASNINESTRWLYERLTGLGYNVGRDVDEFDSLMRTNGESRKWAYETAQKSGLNVGKDYEQFSSLVGAVAPAKPAAQPQPQRVQPQQPTSTTVKPVTDTTAARASVRPTVQTATQPQQPKGWKPSPQQQAAFDMQVSEAQQGLRRQAEAGRQRMEAIRKGSKPTSFMGEREFNPQTGEIDKSYYTTTGQQVTTPLEKSSIDTAARTLWENTTEAGRRSKEARLKREAERKDEAFNTQLSAIWQRHPEEGMNAAERAWSAAEARQRSARERNAARTYGGDPLINGGREMHTVNASINRHADEVSHMTNFDLDRLMQDSWNNLGQKGQQAIIDDCYQLLRRRNPGADEIELYNQAKVLARQQSNLRLYNLAVEKNAPKGNIDYLMRKIGDMNLLINIDRGMAVSDAGTTGDMAAYEEANERYRQDGHKILDVAGMVGGFALDPFTYIAGGFGSLGTKAALWGGGKLLAGRGASAAVRNAATRQFASTLTGRIAGGIAGGAANFGAFEAGKELESQFAHGGHITGRDESGRYINEGYSAEAVGEQALHGLAMGGAIGWLGPLTGNVSDKLVRATASTAGKVAGRAGVYTGATVLEGTIFSVPEWIEGERDGMDVWTDNMAMMAGFKAKHVLKSAGGVLGDLKASFESLANGRKNRMDFESRLRQRMDAPSDGGIALTKDERSELERLGYGDLRELVEDHEDFLEGSKESLTDPKASKIVSRLTDMVYDTRVSEAARAKMYYYATGRMLPTSTVMRGEMIEDGKGGYIVESQGANGVITSRSFNNRKSADLELERINRQAELNNIELGERFIQITELDNRLQEACRKVAIANRWDPVEIYKICEQARRDNVRRENKELDEAKQAILRKVTEELGDFEEFAITDGIREGINEKYGVDIDKAIRKDGRRRTREEQAAIDEYIEALKPKEYRKVVDEEVEDLTDQGLLTDLSGDAFNTVVDAPEDGNGPRGPEGADEDPGGGWVIPHDQAPIGRAVMKYQDRPVDVIRGRVMMMEDGTMVDNAKSDKTIIIRDVETGEIEMVSPEAILTYEDIPAEERAGVSFGEPAEETNGEAPDGGITEGEAPAEGVEPESKYGQGQINIQNSDGTITRGWLTGFLNEEGKHEYVIEGNNHDAFYATEAELDNMIAEYYPYESEPAPAEEDLSGEAFNTVDDASEKAAITPEEKPAETPQGKEMTQEEAVIHGGISGVGEGLAESFAAERERIGNEWLDNEGVMNALRVYADGAVSVEELVERAKADSSDERTKQRLDTLLEFESTRKRLEWLISPSEVAPQTPLTQQEEQQQATAPATPSTPSTPSVLERIPLDEAGEPMFERAENPEYGWDALVEFNDGDVEGAREISEMMMEAKRKELEKLQKQKPKGTTPMQIKKSRDEIVAARNAVEEEYSRWQQIAEVDKARQQAAQAEQEAEARRIAEEEARQAAEAQRIADEQAAEERRIAAEKAEAERIEKEEREKEEQKEREALEGIPEWHLDRPEDARRRGARRFGGQLYRRQEPVEGVVGKEKEVKFSKNDIPKGRVAVIEASELQPSHLQGERNPMFFIEEAQPKERTEAVSVNEARKIAEDIRLEEITEGTTAYTGAPTVNARGEVIQGNNRSDALRYLWENHLPEEQAAYRQHIIENAEDFGVDPEAVKGMKQPVLVNMLDVDDAEAIRLGQMTAQDTESGGIERIKPKNVAAMLGENMRTFANRLLTSADEEASFSQLVDMNGAGVLKWLNQKRNVGGKQVQVINDTQYQSAFDSKGNLTAEAKNDLQKVLYQAIFKGGSQQLEEMFQGLPTKAQRALLGTAFRDMDSPRAGQMLEEIQSSIMAYGQLMAYPQFERATRLSDVLRAVEAFKMETALDDRFEQYSPSDNYSNFALYLAAMYKASDVSQKTLTKHFNDMYDLAQGRKAASLFEEGDDTKYPLAEVVKKVLDIDYKPAKNEKRDDRDGGSLLDRGAETGERGERGTEDDSGDDELSTRGEGTSERGGGTSGDHRGGGLAPTDRGNQEETQTAKQDVVGRSLTFDEARILISEMEESAEVAPELPLTPQNWANEFGADGIIKTPIGEVKQGDNQYLKLAQQGRNGKLGMIKPTLEHPSIIMEDERPANDGNHDRTTSYVFIRTFVKKDGSRYYHFASITVSKKGKEVVISSQERSANRISKLLQQGKVAWIDEKFSLHPTAQIEESVPLNDSNKPTSTDNQPALLGINSSETVISSDRKVNDSASEKQEESAESLDNVIVVEGDGYRIEPKPYVTKRGKEIDTFKVTFGRDFSKEELSGIRAKAKELRGWKDPEGDGWLLRSEKDARAFAEEIAGKSEDEAADEAPLSMAELGKPATAGSRTGTGASSPNSGKKADAAQGADARGKAAEAATPNQAGGTAGAVSGEALNTVANAPKEVEKPRERRWISEEDAAEFDGLHDELRKHFGKDDGMAHEVEAAYGKPRPREMDSEVLRLGTRMTYLMLRGGLRRFSDYCEAMKEELPDIFDEMRPHLKSLYAATQNMEEVVKLGWDDEMDDRKTLKAFDVYNFDKAGAKDIIGTAQHVVDENASQEQSDRIVQTLKEERNEQRKKEADKTSADTEAVVDKGEAAASEVEGELEAATTEEAAEGLGERIDAELEAVNRQLALLGYYEAERSEGPEGFARSAERKVTEDAHRLAVRLAGDLGIELSPEDLESRTDERGYRSNLAESAIGNGGGFAHITLPLDGDHKLRIELGMLPAGGGNLKLGHMHYWVVQRSNGQRSTINEAFGLTKYSDLLEGVRRITKRYLPEPRPEAGPRPGEDLVDMAARVAEEKSEKPAAGAEKPVGEMVGVKTDPADKRLMQEYRRMKKEHRDAILLFRRGKNYRIVAEDTSPASLILDNMPISLFVDGKRIVPYIEFGHEELDKVLPRIVRAGKRVAICEDLEKPEPGKKPGEDLSGVALNTVETPEKEAMLTVDDGRKENDPYQGTVTLKDGREAIVIMVNRVDGFEGGQPRIADYVVEVKGASGRIRVTHDEIAHAGAPTDADRAATEAAIVDLLKNGPKGKGNRKKGVTLGSGKDGGKIGGLFDEIEASGEGSQAAVPKKKPSELSGDSDRKLAKRDSEHGFVDAVGKEIGRRINENGSALTMGEVRKLADEYGLKEVSPTDLQELVERAVSLRARAIAEAAIHGDAASQRAGYEMVVGLYNKQPILSDRDSERVERQQYSTPVPMGYVMNQFLFGGQRGISGVALNTVETPEAGIRLLEPSAGNGALTIGVPKSQCRVNDIDPRRLANLRAMGFKNVTNQDALIPFEGRFDFVVTNPPFGNAPSPRIYDGGYEISTLEGQMAINALESMRDDGRAAIIVGGSIGKWPTPYESNGRLKKVADRQFFGYLYSHYNVVDIIPIDGKSLYSRNGTGYNVRMILIDGRRRDESGNVIREVTDGNRLYPPVMAEARPEPVRTFDELYKRVEDDILRIPERLDVASGDDEGGRTGDGGIDPQDSSLADPRGDRGGERPVGTGNGGRSPRSGLGGDAAGGTRTRPGTDERPAGDRKPSGSTHGDTGSPDRRPVDERPESEGGRNELSAVEHMDRPGDRGGVRHGATDTDGSTERHNSDGARQRGGSGPERLNQPKPVKVELTDEKVASPHVSSSNELQSRMPAAQALEFERALHSIEEKYGNVDEWLTQKLGYADTADLYRALAAEQVEGVAMAIYKMNSGRGFIIADQTGIGKGRQAASIIRYAVRNGHKPIFVTQKAGLFSDMYRDLKDIGSPELRPFIFGSDKKTATITERQEDGTDKVIFALPTPKERDRVYSYIEQHGTLPDEYDYAVTTYSQVQNGTTQYEIGDNGKIEAKPKKYKGKVSAGDITGERRRHVIDILSRGNYLILDEAHTAGGQSDLGGYMQSIIPGVKGITYLSATYAKRPDNMPLYAIKTAISDSGVEVAELINAVAQGGVPLQEIMSRQLVKSGEMARRERDFTGVSIDWIPTDEGVAREQQKRFDTVSEIFVDIMRFQDTYVRPYLNEMSKDLARVGSSSGQKKGTKDMGIGNAPFASKLYNLLQQLLFSIKVDAVADRAIKNLKDGRKPIISFVNTMDGFLKEASIGMTDDGSASMPTLSLALRKALDGVMRYTVKDDNNNESHSELTAAQIGPDADAAYNAIIEKMNAVSDDLPIAPLDAIRLKIEAAGYKVGELSGRELELTKNDKGLYVIRNRKAPDKKAVAADFNAGKIDVLMVNKTGSTGISLHASSKFEDRRQRVMIAAQFQPDVNDEVQMRGRNDRTGQVVRGAYEYLLSSIPAEQRLQMMFKAKLKSLDANTTSSQKSSFNEMEVVDVLNKYGDAIVWDYLSEDPLGLNMDMGNPLGIDQSADIEAQQRETSSRKNQRKDDDDSAHSGFARKALGRLALLPIARQTQIMDEITDRYQRKIHELDERGENDLEISYKDLKTKTLSKKIWVEGKDPGSGNAFADNVYLEEVEANILDKPLSKSELEGFHRTFLDEAGAKNWDEWRQKKDSEIDAYYDDRIKAVSERIRTNKEATIQRRIEKFIETAKEARSLGKNSFTDAEIINEAHNRYGVKERQEAETEIERETEKLRTQQSLIKSRISQLKPMSPIAIPDDLTDESKMNLEPSYGVMVGIKLDNKYSLTGSQIVFAPLDGRRTITLSLREAGVALSKIGHATMLMRDALRKFSVEDWDSHISNESRERRYMLTGNILRALVDMQKSQSARGRITAYTTEDGEVRTGILMSSKFSPTDLRTSAPISSMKSKIEAGKEVTSSNKEVTIRRSQKWSARGEYELLVPKSKQNGGKYYLREEDPKLAQLVAGPFEMPRSGNQAIGYIRAENLGKVLDHLSSKHGTTVMLSSKLKDDNSEGTREPEIEYSGESGNFAEKYITEDGREIGYRSELAGESGEGYGGLFDFDFGREAEGSRGVDDRRRGDDLQRSEDRESDEPGSGLDRAGGEFCLVERRFKENGSFGFTSGERVESAADVAFIFSSLEEAAKEHTFAVYVRDGRATVVELGMGTFTASPVDMATAGLAYSRIRPERVYFVHNHPSGNLECSGQDVEMLRRFERMSDVPVEGVIINLKTGKYGTFDTSGKSGVGQKRVPEQEYPLTVHTLDKQIFARDYDPMAQVQIRNAGDVAAFLNSHRMGDRRKVSFLVLTRANRIVGNMHTPFVELGRNVEAVARYISERVVAFGGESAIVYGDFTAEGREVLRALGRRMTEVGGVRLLDVVRVRGNYTESGKEMGWLYREGAGESGLSASASAQYESGAGVSGVALNTVEVPNTVEAKREQAEKLAKKFNTPIEVVDDGSELPEQFQKKRGWFDPAMGRVVIVAGNHRDVEDVAETVFHEVVAHKGLREMLGDENYDAFCDEVYDHLKDDLKEEVDRETTRRFEREPERGYEHHRRVSVDELFGRLAEKGFEDFTKAERGIWAKLKAKVLEAINKFLGSLKLPKWVKLGDNELRYVLWRSHERLHAKGDYVDMARDLAKREELGLGVTDVVGRKSPKRERIEKLRRSEPIVISGDEISRGETLKEFKKNALEYGKRLQGTYINKDTGSSIQLQRGRRNGGVNELLQHDLNEDNSAQLQSVAALPQIIEEGIYIDSEPNRDTDKNPDVAEYQHYVCGLRINDEDYTVHSIVAVDKRGDRYYDHKLSHIEKGRLLDFIEAKQPTERILATTPGTEPTIRSERKVKEIIKLLQVNDAEIDFRFREGETGDIWKDGSLGLEERMTAARVRLSERNGDDGRLRQDAIRAIGGNLTSLRRAMAAQRRYDRSTVKRVADLARVLMQSGYLSGMTSGEVQRLVSAVKNATGASDMTGSVQKIMDIMVGNQLRNGEEALHRLLAIRGSKVDAHGVKVQGALDVEGQRIMKEMKDAMSLGRDYIANGIADVQERIGDPGLSEAKQENAFIRHTGLSMALDYVENIHESKAEEKSIRDGLKTAKEERDAGRMTADAYKQFAEATEDAIRKNKIERAEAYFNLVGRLSEILRGSIERAKAFHEAEKARISEIHHHANSDMEGRPHYEHGKKKSRMDKLSNLLAGSILSPLATFEQYMRLFGGKSIDGRGYLFEDFVVGMQKCRDQEWLDLQRVEGVLNQKGSETLGRKDVKWTDLHTLTRKTAGTVEWWDGGEMREHAVTQGNLMYVYMADKMTDGRVKLRSMGIDEAKMEEITKALDPTLRELADWIQDEFLPEFREEINEVHMRMFGAPMAEIDNYFPLKVLGNAREQKEDISQFIETDGLPKTMTGAIIERQFNTCALDILHADPVDEVIDHVRKLLEWKNTAEYRRDLGTLLSYKRFRNQVKNMTTIYGSGEYNWKQFKKLSLLVGGAHLPETNEFDRFMVNCTKLATGACIALNLNSAIKQILSYPAFLSEANAVRLAYNMTPHRARYCWKWAMENLPAFQRRWMSRQAGNHVLREFEGDWDWTKKDFIQKIQRLGMSPNAFIDGLTISMGSEAVYHSKFKEYRKFGYSEKKAREKAIVDAEIIFNLSQQSSETMFLSLLQNSRSYITTVFTNFRNSAMSYARQTVQAIREGWNMCEHKIEQINYETKKAVREGLSEEDARRMAKHKYNRQWSKVIVKIADFAMLLPALWAFGISGLWYSIFGNDEEKKKENATNAIKRGVLLGWAEGFVGGGTIPDLMYSWLNGEPVNFSEESTPAAASFAEILNAWGNGQREKAIHETINFAVSVGVGANPQYVENAVAAGLDFFGHDEKSRKDYEMLILRLVSVPQSQLDQIYIDELGLNGKEAGRLTPEQLAQRYAEYNMKRGKFLAPWAWNDEDLLDKEKQRVIKKMKERLESSSGKDVLEAYADFETRYKAVSKKAKEAKALMKTDYVEGAKAYAVLQQDQDFGLYQRFDELDKPLGRMSKMWLTSKSPEEASLVASTIISYRTGMVKVLQAEDEKSQQSAMSELTTLINDFYAKYYGMQSK